ncbi:MAG: short-chain dehydrogenase [Acidimicrobiales bacterium mtb01]|nr:glucose 1-dehydrogenase [Actinomycetota bacterium]TEX45406.1 MAG: short-chain dehydrogenase [Acidimicrobiales bacterium mtb01]
MIPDHSNKTLAQLLDLSGRRAVVTGGAKGIGAQTARRLAEAGADVVVADLDLSAATMTATDIANATGRTIVAAFIDVGDTSSIVAAADAAMSRLGGIDIWVNNAGIYPTTGPAIEATDEFIDRMLSINVRGSFAGAREAAKRMKSGVIINLASIAGLSATAGISAYVMSKHAVIGMTKVLSREFAPLDIRVVAVAPGPIDTPGVQDQLAPLKAAGVDVGAMLSKTPLGRGGVPDDIARAIVFLASDMAAWVNAETLVVDAGSLAR